MDGLVLPTSRLREGYDMAQVDAFLAGVRDDAVRGVVVGPERVAQARFTPVRMREGYEMGAVDAALAELGRRLGAPAQRGAGRPPAPVAPPSTTPSERSVTHDEVASGGGLKRVVGWAMVVVWVGLLAWLLVVLFG